MECLLAYIELTQFQQYIIANNRDNGKITSETFKALKLTRFPSSIPMSSIVEEDIVLSKFNKMKNNAYEYKLKGYKLFDKYIKTDSEFEINISWQQRNAWMSMMSTASNLWAFMQTKVDLNELLLLVEDSKNVMRELMDHSLFRFKSYDSFNEIIQALSAIDSHEHSKSSMNLSSILSSIGSLPSLKDIRTKSEKMLNVGLGTLPEDTTDSPCPPTSDDAQSRKDSVDADEDPEIKYEM